MSENERTTCSICGSEMLASFNCCLTAVCSECRQAYLERREAKKAKENKDGILISRRTFMMLPIEERRRIMEEQCKELVAAGYGEEE